MIDLKIIECLTDEKDQFPPKTLQKLKTKKFLPKPDLSDSEDGKESSRPALGYS